jgi:hypothetical protein
MIKAKIKNVEYEIKTSWEDLTYGEYLSMVESKDEIESISILSGIPSEEIILMDEDSQKNLSYCLAFLSELPEGEVEAKDIREETFGQKVVLQQEMTKQSHERLIGVSVAVYQYNYHNLEESFLEVTKRPFNEVYLLGLNYLKQFAEICKSEQEHLKSHTTNEQMRAGIQMFDEFGVMNTVDSLAQGNVLNYEKILEIDYNTIFIKLKMIKFASIYKENYSKIMSKKR